jgi:sugar (pentulose or hexulose) kinase
MGGLAEWRRGEVMYMLVMGIDVGTQGARAMVTDLSGVVKAEVTESFGAETLVSTGEGAFEQDPRMWREALELCLTGVVSKLADQGVAADAIAAVAVTSTSGTLCLCDARGEPVGNAIMYSDARSAEVVPVVRAASAAWETKMVTRMGASYALTKAVWLAQADPGRVERARWLLSPADLVTGWLTGEPGVADWTSALKWGYDVVDLIWPPFIWEKLGVARAMLPRVVAPGQAVGRISSAVARATGLSPRTMVAAGATDGNASQLASGAASLGDWNSTLGTTLVLKGVTSELVRDPEGRIYCHRHPDGHWSPGGASSTGADCLTLRFGADRLEALNASALERSPTGLVVYPLTRRGERFPFVQPEAEGFALGQAPDDATLYAAYLEGLAYVERLAYEVVASLGAEVGPRIYCAGGGSRSAAGLQIRADVLGKELVVPQHEAGAMGAAMLAARASHYASVGEAVASMVRLRSPMRPRSDRAEAYQEGYGRFVEACRQRGYLA